LHPQNAESSWLFYWLFYWEHPTFEIPIASLHMQNVQKENSQLSSVLPLILLLLGKEWYNIPCLFLFKYLLSFVLFGYNECYCG
jgi:hypothetical protein